MKRSKFTEKHKISLAKPTSIDVNKITVCDFASTLESFLDDNFKGAVAFNSVLTAHSTEYISICSVYVAYAVKYILAHLRGERVLHVSINSNEENKFVMRIECNDFWDMSTEERHEMVEAVHQTRFLAYHSDRGFVLKKRMRSRDFFALHAMTKNSFREVLEEVFFSSFDEECAPDYTATKAKESESIEKAQRDKTLKNLHIK